MPTKFIKSDKSTDEPIDSKAPAQASAEQLRKFEEAARALGTDDDPERFKKRVRKLAGASFSQRTISDINSKK